MKGSLEVWIGVCKVFCSLYSIFVFLPVGHLKSTIQAPGNCYAFAWLSWAAQSLLKGLKCTLKANFFKLFIIIIDDKKINLWLSIALCKLMNMKLILVIPKMNVKLLILTLFFFSFLTRASTAFSAHFSSSSPFSFCWTTFLMHYI